MGTNDVPVPPGWSAGPNGTIMPPDGWSEDPSGISLVGDGSVPADGPITLLCYRQTGQPPSLQPLFQGMLNKDGTLTILDHDGHPIGTGRFALDGEAVQVTLANGNATTIDLRGTTLQVAGKTRGSTFTVGSDGQLTLVGASALGDGTTKIRVGSQLLLIPIGAVVTVDALGHLFVNGQLLSQASTSRTTVTTWIAPPPPGMDSLLQLDDGSEITVGQYANYMTVDIQSMSDLAGCISSWADSVDYAMTFLDMKLTGVRDAIGNDEPGQRFMPQYKQWHSDTADGFRQMSASLRELAGSLNDAADRLFKTEDANLRKFVGKGASDPRLTPPPADIRYHRPGGGSVF